jgi:hypothetical protein
VLLPAVAGPRRADSAHVILGALLATPASAGSGRSPLSCLRHRSPCAAGCAARAGCRPVRGESMRLAAELDPLLGPVDPAGSALDDALGAAVMAVRLRLGPIGSPTAATMIIGNRYCIRSALDQLTPIAAPVCHRLADTETM